MKPKNYVKILLFITLIRPNGFFSVTHNQLKRGNDKDKKGMSYSYLYFPPLAAYLLNSFCFIYTYSQIMAPTWAYE